MNKQTTKYHITSKNSEKPQDSVFTARFHLARRVVLIHALQYEEKFRAVGNISPAKWDIVNGLTISHPYRISRPILRRFARNGFSLYRSHPPKLSAAANLRPGIL